MEGYVGVQDDMLVVPTESLLYGLIPAMGGTTAFAVCMAYVAHVDVYKEIPSTIALARVTGLTRQTVSKALRDLEEAGLDMRELGVNYLEEYA